jgi:hypothetical protein
MELTKGNSKFEELIADLNDEKFLEDYKKLYDNYKVSWLPKFLGNILVFCGNLVYGTSPNILKFRSVEIIARVPYFSWTAANFTLMTMFFADEKKALKYSNAAKFAQFSQENETMHVVVISHLASLERRAGIIRFTLIPMFFSFFYYWISYVLYLVNKRYSYELNFMFENHAFEQYDEFIKFHETELKAKKVESEFLSWYGRYPITQYDFFRSVRNDEIVHRNTSIVEITNTK